MAIINTNGQPVTSEASESADNQTKTQPGNSNRVPLTAQQVQQLIGAYARLKELANASILTPKDEAEKAGLVNFIQGGLFTNAEEFFGCWVVLQNEYTPLISGFTSLMRRALARIDHENRPAVTEVVQENK